MSPTVLVADDSKTIRKVVQMALKASDYEVVGVDSAREALQAAKEQPEVILLDYYMPDGSGYEVCEALKKDGTTRGIPVIMLGGTYRPFDAEKARQSGAVDVVMKPFKTDPLIEAIDKAVEQAGAEAGPPSREANRIPPKATKEKSESSPPPFKQPSEPMPQAAPQGSGSAPQKPQKPQKSQKPQKAQPSKPASNGAAPTGQKRAQRGREPMPVGGPKNGEDRSLKRQAQATPAGGQPSVQSQSGAQPQPKPQTRSKPKTQPKPQTQPPVPESQPRIGVGGSGASGSQASKQPGPKKSQPAATPAPTGGESAAPAMSRDEIEAAIEKQVKTAVREQLPGLLRNVMGDIFQQKVLPRLLDHTNKKIDKTLDKELDQRIIQQVRRELERLLEE